MTFSKSADLIKIASLDDIPADLTRVGGGFYRSAHAIWELRPSEDDSGYVLVRKREERAADLRRTAQLVLVPADATSVTDAPSGMSGAEPCPACGCNCPCGCNDCTCEAMSDVGHPHIEPSSKAEEALTLVDGAAPELGGAPSLAIIIAARAKRARSSVDEKLHQIVAPIFGFSPEYMGGGFKVNPDDREVYEVAGYSIPDPDIDRVNGIPNPILPHPNAGEHHQELNLRVKLRPVGGNADSTIFVTPMELDRFFEITGPPPSSSQPDDSGESFFSRPMDPTPEELAQPQWREKSRTAPTPSGVEQTKLIRQPTPQRAQDMFDLDEVYDMPGGAVSHPETDPKAYEQEVMPELPPRRPSTRVR